MTKHLGALLAGFIALASACTKPEAENRHPNIVVLLADDLGFADVGFHAHGDPAIRTPNIDRLAGRSLCFEHYYTAPLCTPARAGLLTGRSPIRHGLLSNLNQRDTGSLPLGEHLLPEALHAAGYRTAMAGKWHLGHARPEMAPNARGFDSFYGLLGGWIDYSTHRRDERSDWQRDGKELDEQGYSTDLIAREAVHAIEERDRERPLFLYVAFNAPHAPVHLPPGRKLAEIPASDSTRAAYALMVQELDRAVGEVLEALERAGMTRDTIVLFASDNGGDLEYGASNAPLRGGKFEVFEGGIRAPALLAWPARLPTGKRDFVLSYLDVMPTLCGLAGVELADRPALDGRDLSSALASSEQPPAPELVFACERQGEARWAVVDGSRKLVEIQPEGAVPASTSLFDLTTDPDEAHDLATSEPDELATLRTTLEKWRGLAGSAR